MIKSAHLSAMGRWRNHCSERRTLSRLHSTIKRGALFHALEAQLLATQVSFQIIATIPATRMISLDSDLASQEPWEKSSDTEGSTLLGQEVRLNTRLSSVKSNLHTIALYTSNLILLAIVGILSIRLKKLSSFDPSIQIYCAIHGCKDLLNIV